jgi:hypothetical protein
VVGGEIIAELCLVIARGGQKSIIESGESNLRLGNSRMLNSDAPVSPLGFVAQSRELAGVLASA